MLYPGLHSYKSQPLVIIWPDPYICKVKYVDDCFSVLCKAGSKQDLALNVVAIEKGSLGSPLTTVTNFTLLYLHMDRMRKRELKMGEFANTEAEIRMFLFI